jgi:hypothetical protein
MALGSNGMPQSAPCLCTFPRPLPSVFHPITQSRSPKRASPPKSLLRTIRKREIDWTDVIILLGLFFCLEKMIQRELPAGTEPDHRRTPIRQARTATKSYTKHPLVPQDWGRRTGWTPAEQTVLVQSLFIFLVLGLELKALHS